jgi:hypothetical protein
MQPIAGEMEDWALEGAAALSSMRTCWPHPNTLFSAILDRQPR